MTQRIFGELPSVSDKDLLAMNQLMADKSYRIKSPANFFRPDRQDRVCSDFVLYTLNDYLGHLQNCVASTRKLLPTDMEGSGFGPALRHTDAEIYRFISIISSIDLRQLSVMLSGLQKAPEEVSVADLQPFVGMLFMDLMKVYYLGVADITKKYRTLFSVLLKIFAPADEDRLRQQASIALQEWQYLFDHVYTGLYPLVLRMTSPVVLSMHQLYYSNGSKILAWLGLQPSDIMLATDKPSANQAAEVGAPAEPEKEDEEKPYEIPEAVRNGLAILEELFPEAGWTHLEEHPDMCGYFQPILEFQDAFSQLSPENPLHQELILFFILEELFQGLRLIKFEPLPILSIRDDVEDINTIVETWILYKESIFDKGFSADLKSFTHQEYTQPGYSKTPYGRKLLSNLYTTIRSMFLPHFDIRVYGTAKLQKDDRLPPLFIRISRLKRLLLRYKELIDSDIMVEKNPEAAIPGILNPWAPYKFDIANSVSKRLDMLLSSKRVKAKTNAILIEYTLSILLVLDWWVNDKSSFAYKSAPDYLYRVTGPDSSVPAFGVKPRTDVDALFSKHLRVRT
jgi:hypothetical protein